MITDWWACSDTVAPVVEALKLMFCVTHALFPSVLSVAFCVINAV